MIRVLIVDDSPTLRQLIRLTLESDPELQVVGEARNGEEAISLADRLHPDLITMDIRMPKMNGYDAIRHIMSSSPRPIVVLTSTLSDRELGISFKAVEAGALTVLGKPRGLPGTGPETRQLVDQIKAMAGVKVVRRRDWRRAARPGSTVTSSQAPSTIAVVAIAASTGGPPALYTLLSAQPADLLVPIVVVQHLSPGFVSALAQWLDETTPLQVKVAANGEVLCAGTVYLAPDDRHLLVARPGVCWLRSSPPEDGHRPSATVLLRSLAETYGAAAAGIVLTGMGRDGAAGLQLLRHAGGSTFAQDQASSIVYGMPRAAVELDAAQEVLPLEQIAARLRTLAAPPVTAARRTV